MNRQDIEDYTVDLLMKRYQEKEDLVGSDIMRQTERMVMLQVIDDQWKDHLLSIDELKQGIGMRGYGQKDPLVEYKKESYDLFTALQQRIDEESLRYLFFLQAVQGERPPLPFPEEEEDEEEEENNEPTELERQAASSVLHPGFHAQYPAQEGSRAGRAAVRRRRRTYECRQEASDQ